MSARKIGAKLYSVIVAQPESAAENSEDVTYFMTFQQACENDRRNGYCEVLNFQLSISCYTDRRPLEHVSGGRFRLSDALPCYVSKDGILPAGKIIPVPSASARTSQAFPPQDAR